MQPSATSKPSLTYLIPYGRVLGLIVHSLSFSERETSLTSINFTGRNKFSINNLGSRYLRWIPGDDDDDDANLNVDVKEGKAYWAVKSLVNAAQVQQGKVCVLSLPRPRPLTTC
jgi:hypothetical protein